MMILAWDTSGAAESVAVLHEEGILSQRWEPQVDSHSEQLLPMIEQVLDEASLSLSQIDVFAVTVGPGSFTGLRIGLSTAKALARVFNKPVAPVSTLLALAEPHLLSFPLVLSCMDARLREVFVAVYQALEGELGYREKFSAQRLPVADLKKLVETLPGSCLGLGSGFEAYPELREIPGLQVLETAAAGVQAVSVGRLARLMVNRGELVSGNQLQALYLRLSEAENRLRQKRASINLQ